MSQRGVGVGGERIVVGAGRRLDPVGGRRRRHGLAGRRRREVGHLAVVLRPRRRTTTAGRLGAGGDLEARPLIVSDRGTGTTSVVDVRQGRRRCPFTM